MKLSLGLVALTVIATSAAGANYDLYAEQQAVKTNQAKWNTFLSNSSCGGYVMKFARDCFCSTDWRGPYQVVVNSTGGIASSIYLDGSEECLPPRAHYLQLPC